MRGTPHLQATETEREARTLALGPSLGSKQGVQDTKIPGVSVSHPLKKGPLGVNAKDLGLLPREDLGPLQTYFRSPARAQGHRSASRRHAPHPPLTSQITRPSFAIGGGASLPKVGDGGCCWGSGRAPVRRPQGCPWAGGGGGVLPGLSPSLCKSHFFSGDEPQFSPKF